MLPFKGLAFKGYRCMNSRKSVFVAIYSLVAKVPKGRVITYGLVANFLKQNMGLEVSPRLVGFALHKNKDNKKIPCHRVVFKDGSLSSKFAFGGLEAQRRKLEEEGITFTSDGRVNLKKCLWRDLKF
jgi:methylated-DNA-protein-cysteine methyltransferase-like protein